MILRVNTARGGDGGIKKLTGDEPREERPDLRPGLRRRLVDELDISGLW